MFIRWIIRGHKNTDLVDVTFHDAYLVESYRDEDGEPRQRTITYLGNIRQIGDEFPAIERELFLLRAELLLESMPELSTIDCDDVICQLHRKVPPLDHEEMLTGFHNTLSWYYRWWGHNGGFPSREELHRIVDNIGVMIEPV